MTINFTKEDVLNYLWDRPGERDRDIAEHFIGTGDAGFGATKEQRQAYRILMYEMLLEMTSAGDITVVRFTTWAPFLTTTYRWFPTAKGRIEVCKSGDDRDRGDDVFAFVYDPLNLYDSIMEKYLD